MADRPLGRLKILWDMVRGAGRESVVACDPPEPRPGVARGRFRGKSIWSELRFAFFDDTAVAPTWGAKLHGLRGAFRELADRMLELTTELSDPSDVLFEIANRLAHEPPSLPNLLGIAYHLGMLDAWRLNCEITPACSVPLLESLDFAAFESVAPRVSHRADHTERTRRAIQELRGRLAPASPRIGQ